MEAASASWHDAELRRHPVASLIQLAYPVLRGARRRRVALALVHAIRRLEGGGFHSLTAREILRDHHGVTVGAYSYGECLRPGSFPAGVTVGRYASIAQGVRVITQNHPYERLSQHPFFYDSAAGFAPSSALPVNEVWIGHDTWLGAGVIVTPGCASIGIGAVVGAGAVVTRSVEPFAIVAGNPARTLRYRFDQETRERILESSWWLHPIGVVAAYLDDLVRPLSGWPATHPLLPRVAASSPLSSTR